MATEIIRPENVKTILRHTDDKVVPSADMLSASHGTLIHTIQTNSPLSDEGETIIRGLTPDQARELAKALNEFADITEAQR